MERNLTLGYNLIYMGFSGDAMERLGKTATLVVLLGTFALAAGPSAADIIRIDPERLVFTKQVRNQVVNVPTTGVVRPLTHYVEPGFDAGLDAFTFSLNFRSAASLKEFPDGRTILDVVKEQFEPKGWTFSLDTDFKIADDTFLIHTYEALAPAPPPQNTDAWTLLAKADPKKNDVEAACVRLNDCVGSELYFTYNPTRGDPTNDVHWIQILESSDRGIIVDVAKNNTMTPFYDVGGTAGSRGFFDDPNRNSPTDPHSWFGSILLVTSPAPEPGNPFPPGLVTAYGELDWGWGNRSTPLFPVPEPASLALFIPALLTLVLCAGMKSVRRAKLSKARGQPTIGRIKSSVRVSHKSSMALASRSGERSALAAAAQAP